MRVLLPTIRDPDQIGGGGTHLTMLVKGLRELGHDAEALYLTATMSTSVSHASLVWPAGALNRMRTGWGMVYSADARGRMLSHATERELKRAASAGDVSRRGSWQVLNAQEVYAVPYLRSVADDRGIPLVLTLHGYPVYESVSEGYSTSSRMGLHYLMRTELRALRLADAVVTVDSRLYRHVLRLVPERADTVFTLLNFIDTSAFTPSDDAAEEASTRRELRAAWGIPEDKVVLFCPRRLVKKNGVIYPSLALAAMDPDEREHFVLLHAGEGGEREEIERIVSEHRLEAYVRLLGGQGTEVVRELYRLADIVLVPSVHSENVEEATSLSALEAMASGRPLIAGNVGGLAEMLADGETGLLVPADAEALAAAILRLAAAPELASRLAAAAREYVVAHHSHLRAAGAYADVYAVALAGAGRAAGEGRASLADFSARARSGEPLEPGEGAPFADSRQPQASKPLWASLSILGLTVDAVSLEQAAQWVIACADEGFTTPTGVDLAGARMSRATPARLAVSFNPELAMRALDDPSVAEALLHADLCFPDGVGAVWAAGRQGVRRHVVAEAAEHMTSDEAEGRSAPTSVAPGPLERVPGIDLAARVLELAEERSLSVFFLGAGEGVAAEAARRQAERLPGLRVAGTHHGYFDAAGEEEVVEMVRCSGADILLVAMGAPKQEIFMYRQRERLGTGVALGVGGSFDVWAGKITRAPAWAQAAKIEWLYRLLADPRRIRRQMALPQFAAKVMRWSPDDYGPPRRGRAARTRIGSTVGIRHGPATGGSTTEGESNPGRKGRDS